MDQSSFDHSIQILHFSEMIGIIRWNYTLPIKPFFFQIGFKKREQSWECSRASNLF